MKLSLLWLIACCAEYAGSNFLSEYEEMKNALYSREINRSPDLTVNVGVDKTSGCICRGTPHFRVIVCFGNYLCKRFPQISTRSIVFRVRTTVIVKIAKRELDKYYYLKFLEIEANHQLRHIEPGAFKNLTELEHLSISYNTALHFIHENIFEGLVNLRNLTLVNNGFTNVVMVTTALSPRLLPSLTALDVSENALEQIDEHTFVPMAGSHLKTLAIKLCRLDFVHPKSFYLLKMLKELDIGENEINSTLIGDFLLGMIDQGINLTQLDLSGLGFRKSPPRRLMEIIANSTIKRLMLGHNQFEVIEDEAFPRMVNIELLDLRRVLALSIDKNAFEPYKFPNLKFLLLGGNNLPGIHQKHLSNQLLLLDMSYNKGNPANPVYFEIDRDIFNQSKHLLVLNLSFNNIKSIFDYSFRGMDELKYLSLENGTVFYIGPGTFKATKKLEILNLGNNPITANQNLTCAQFEGLNQLKVLILQNCGIRHFNDDDNIFEMMPNLTHLILRSNQLYYITADTIKPMKFLQVLDVRDNLLVAWWRPLFLAAGVKPLALYLRNNKISRFSTSMVRDLSYLFENGGNSTEVDLMDNVFICDCYSMHTIYLWLEVNGSFALKEYFRTSHFQCTGPDLWENRLVLKYLESMKNLSCPVRDKFSNTMMIIWTAPTFIMLAIVLVIAIAMYKYRFYIRYWLFLGKIALGRRFIRRPLKAENCVDKGYRYDAFVSYCFEDREFVLEMITQLEESNPPHLKLCVSERDFEVGSFISEAILSSINDSKYIILLISNRFAKSQWCRWETQLAEYHRMFQEDGTTYDPLILLRLEDVENKYMSPTLKYLMKTKIYLSWDQKHSDDFWKKLRNVLLKNT